jgi:hypothetical protein
LLRIAGNSFYPVQVPHLAREVAEAIDRGAVDVDDPRTMTVQWYRHLLDSGANSPVVLAARGTSRS